MPVKMLIVDDEPDLESLIRQKFRRQIRDEEYEFVFAHSGVEALARIEEHPDTSLVLSDINMPDMDGLTLLDKLGELNRPTLKAVIVSAYGDMQNIRTAMNRGAFDFVTKPIDFNDLQITIDKTLSHLSMLKRAMESQEKLLGVQRDLSIATRIQQSILKRDFPPYPDRTDFSVYADMVPAKEVGGDFYDFFFIDNDRLAFVIGDVSGKGVPAAIFMAVCRTLLKAVAMQVINPGESLRRVNAMLIPESDAAMFVTVFYGILNTKTGEVQYSNGGHNSPYLIRSDGAAEQLKDVGGLFLGKLDDLEYDVQKITLQPGDTILLYTDGVTEAMDATHNLYGDERLVACLAKTNGVSLEGLLQQVKDDLGAYVNGAPQSDDITMLAVRYHGRK